MAAIESPQPPAVKRAASRLRPANRLYQWHMRVGLWIALAVTLWALSGLGHPVISRLNPKPTAFLPPLAPLAWSGLQSPQAILQAAGIDRFQALRLWQPDGENPVYRIEAQGQTYWIDARTAAVHSASERVWVERLARHYAGDLGSPIAHARVLHSFNNDYHYIDRLLPVWEIGFNRPDGLRAYVDPASGRLATLTDRRKDWTGKLFRWMHSWSPIQPSPWVRGLMLGLLLTIAAVAGAGLTVYARLWRRGALSGGRPVGVRWHRQLGVPAAVVALALSLSGAFHLAVKSWQGDPTAPAAMPSFATNELGAPLPTLIRTLASGGPIVALVLTRLEGQPAWIAIPETAAPAPMGHTHGPHGDVPSEPAVDPYLDAVSGEVIPDGIARHATALARQHADLPPGTAVEVHPVHHFDEAYGFAFKRLPVMAVTLPERPDETWYVETRTGALAAHVTPLSRLEGWVFGMVHKWSFLDGTLGKAGRETLQALTALALVLTAALGVARHFSRWRRKAG
jgi:hypothetical protein